MSCRISTPLSVRWGGGQGREYGVGGTQQRDTRLAPAVDTVSLVFPALVAFPQVP